MNRCLIFTIFSAAIVFTLSMLGGCTCGFDCNREGSGNTNQANFSLGFASSPPQAVKAGTLKVRAVTLTHNDGTTTRFDSFDASDTDLSASDGFEMNLRQHPGRNALTVIDQEKIATGTYSAITIDLVSTGADPATASNVQTLNDVQLPIRVESDQLVLEGFTLSSAGIDLVIDLNLIRSLSVDSSQNHYELNGQHLRLQDVANSAALTGEIDLASFTAEPACSSNPSTAESNSRLYLYEGDTLVTTNLTDFFDSSSTTTPPSDAIAPFTAVSPQANQTDVLEYDFGYLPAGRYTIAYVCDVASDDPRTFENLPIPTPNDQLYPVTLVTGSVKDCAINESASQC